MSKSSNMLRTRRKDNNVKPNRRLDRKSSRGMLYENEELRLKTININAEVERGQSDIKKLKRENDQLRREIWYLRDEYDKLDKLLREKGSLSSASSSTCSSESESCSSFSEESEAVETSQNIENVNKTHLKKLNEEFDHLSIVQEENSGENSDKNSNSNHVSWGGNLTLETGIIKADQSYPVYDSINNTNGLSSPKHFFSPIKMNKPNDDYVNNQFLGPDLPYADRSYSPEIYFDDPPPEESFSPYSTYHQPLTMPVLDKTTTDVIVKTDNRNFNTLNSHSSFSNGGNLEELLNDIETISHDILTISNSQNQMYQNRQYVPFESLHEDNNISYIPATRVDNYEFVGDDDGNEDSIIKPYKSELNVVLMPTPMKLIEIEKYKNIQKSCESINQRSIENLSSGNNIKIIPEILTPNLIIPPDQFCGTPIQPHCPEPDIFRREQRQETNPFFFGNIRHSPHTSDFVTARALPEQDHSWPIEPTKKFNVSPQQKESEVYSSKANLLETAISSDHVSSENEENLKFKTTRNENEPTPDTTNQTEKINEQPKPEPTKSKLGLKGKVSIHFKGKKDKSTKNKNAKREASGQEKKSSVFDLKLDKKLVLHKTPSTESKISTTPVLEPKTPTSADSSDTKNCEANCDKIPTSDRKSRKSSSASPERRHDGKKVHKRHKKLDKSKNRRSSIGTDQYNRERSYSICTDRSNILDRRLGFCSAYDDFTMSERENSLSSCETLKGRKLSVSHFPTGKIPWCGCWGNGCL